MRKINLLRDVKIRKRFEEKVVDVGGTTLWGHFKDGMLNSCGEVLEEEGEDK